jgi:hypothetical protein
VPALEPPIYVDAERQAERAHTGALQPDADRGNRGLVWHRWKRVGVGAWRLGRIVAAVASNPVQALGCVVPRREGLVGEGPRRGHAVGVLHRREILRTVADQHRAVELGIAADMIVVARSEPPTGVIQPGLVGAKRAVAENAIRIASRCVVGDVRAPLEDRDRCPGRRQPGGERGSAHSRADDHDIRRSEHHGLGVCTA